MRVDEQRQPCSYPFERRVLDALAEAPPDDGFVTGNLVIPHVRNRWLPNELDLVVLLTGYVYVIEAKELMPGTYRGGPGESRWEFSADGVEFAPVECLVHPYGITLQKQRAMHSWIRQLLAARKARDPSAQVPEPTVVGVLVVPDDADVSGLAWGPERILKANVSKLASTIVADWEKNKQRRPSVGDLEELLALGTPTQTTIPQVSRLPCCLSPDLEIVEPLGDRITRPVERDVYRGQLHGRVPVRVEVIRKASTQQRRQRRAIRNYFEAFSLLCKQQAMVVLRSHHDRPSDHIVVTELFSRETLDSVVKRGHEPLSWTQAARIFLPIYELLCAGHQQGLAHRYLDPSCILLKDARGSRPEVRVNGYYGALVADMSAITAAGSSATPYLAPEAGAVGTAKGNLLDAFSFGHCLRLALTGDPRGDLTRLDDPGVVSALEDLCCGTPAERRSIGWDAMAHLLRAAAR